MLWQTYNRKQQALEEGIASLDDVGGPDSGNSHFVLGYLTSYAVGLAHGQRDPATILDLIERGETLMGLRLGLDDNRIIAAQPNPGEGDFIHHQLGGA